MELRKYRLVSRTLSVLLMLLFSVSFAVSESGPVQLISKIYPRKIAAQQALDQGLHELKGVRINPAALHRKNFTVRLGGRNYTALREQKRLVSTKVGKPGLTITGKLKTLGEQANGRFVIALAEESKGKRNRPQAISAFFLPEPKLGYSISGNFNADRQRLRLTSSWQTGGIRQCTQLKSPVAPQMGPAIMPAATMPAEGSPSVVDMLIVFLPRVRDTAGGFAQAQTHAQLCISLLNAAYQASQINVEMRLAGVMVTSQDIETDAASSDMLNRLVVDGDGYYDDVPPMRSQVGADLVYLFVSESNGGIAYIPSAPIDPRKQAFRGAGLGPAILSTNKCTAFYHEVGHIFGGAHNIEISAPDAGLFPYSHGYLFWAEGTAYRTWLSYSSWPVPIYQSGLYSNPNVLFHGVPAGTEEVQNVARTHNESAPLIATYSDYINLSPVELKISARAVGPDSQEFMLPIEFVSGDPNALAGDIPEVVEESSGNVYQETAYAPGLELGPVHWGSLLIRRYQSRRALSNTLRIPHLTLGTSISLTVAGNVLTGTVTATAGQPVQVAGDFLSIYRRPIGMDGASTRIATLSTDSQGSFKYTLSEPGVYQARLSGWSKSSDDVFYLPIPTATATATSTKAPDVISLTLRRKKTTAREYTLEGVLLINSTPAKSQSVNLLCSKVSNGFKQTDTAGKFLFRVKRPKRGKKALSCQAVFGQAKSGTVKVATTR